MLSMYHEFLNLHEQYCIRGGINMIGVIGVIIILIVGFGYSQMRKAKYDRDLQQKAQQLESELHKKS